ncbi:MAG: glycosyltransferase family 2 protein [Bacteroidota bacterium]
MIKDTTAHIDVSVITVTMNSLKTIPELMESLYDNGKPEVSFETIIIDNCSKDGTVDFIRKHYPQVRIIENTSIKGFAENNNIGIRHSLGETIAVINPDVIILPGALDILVSYLRQHPNVGIVGPKLLNKDYTVQESIRRFIDARTLFFRVLYWGKSVENNQKLRHYLMLDSDKNGISEVDWIIGAAMIVRREAIQAIGAFDEKFFLYIEDQDWCYRMWKAGWSVHFNPNAVMIHDHQRESVKKIFTKKLLFHAKSLLYFLWKHKRF